MTEIVAEQLTPEYFEQQYNSRLSIPDAVEYNARAVSRSREARLLLRSNLDVPYGSWPRARLDLFHGHGRAPHPLLVFIHGGYWRSRDKSEFSFVASPFASRGITVAVPDYDLVPAVTVEQIVQQMLAAVAWLYRHAGDYEIDRDRIFVAGHSAGGQLAAMMLAAQWPTYGDDLPRDLVKGAYGVSGIYDLRPILHFSLNEDIRLDEKSAKKASPVSYCPEGSAPLYTAVGALESDEFKRQARLIQQAWKHAHHMEIPHCHHLSMLEALVDKHSPLYASALRMIQG